MHHLIVSRVYGVSCGKRKITSQKRQYEKPRGDRNERDTQFRRGDKAASFAPQTASRGRDAGQLSERRIVVGGIIIVSARATCLRLSRVKRDDVTLRRNVADVSLSAENRKLKSVI